MLLNQKQQDCCWFHLRLNSISTFSQYLLTYIAKSNTYVFVDQTRKNIKNEENCEFPFWLRINCLELNSDLASLNQIV